MTSPGSSVTGIPASATDCPNFSPSNRVRFVGEPVAFVIATDRYRAEDLVQLVDIEYRPLPVIASINDAMAEGTAALHPEWNGKHRRDVRASPWRCCARAFGFGAARAPAIQLRSSSTRSAGDARRRCGLRRRAARLDGLALDPAALQRAAKPLEPARASRAARPRDRRGRRGRIRFQIASLCGGDHRRACEPSFCAGRSNG